MKKEGKKVRILQKQQIWRSDNGFCEVGTFNVSHVIPFKLFYSGGNFTV